MEPSSMTRRGVMSGATAAVAATAAAVMIRPVSADPSPSVTTLPSSKPVQPITQSTARTWLRFIPDSNNPTVVPLLAAADIAGITRCLAIQGKLIIVLDTGKSAYSVNVEFEPDGDSAAVLNMIISGQLTDLLDRQLLKIKKISIDQAQIGA